jgi:hypothetical protein
MLFVRALPEKPGNIRYQGRNSLIMYHMAVIKEFFLENPGNTPYQGIFSC